MFQLWNHIFKIIIIQNKHLIAYWYTFADLWNTNIILPIMSFLLADQVCYEVRKKEQGTKICDEKGGLLNE